MTDTDVRALILAEVGPLPGDLRVELGHDLMRDTVLVRVIQRFASRRQYAAFTTVPWDLLDADPVAAAVLVGRAAGRRLRPWLDPDRIAWPAFDPFPRVTAVQRWAVGLFRRAV